MLTLQTMFSKLWVLPLIPLPCQPGNKARGETAAVCSLGLLSSPRASLLAVAGASVPTEMEDKQAAEGVCPQLVAPWRVAEHGKLNISPMFLWDWVTGAEGWFPLPPSSLPAPTHSGQALSELSPFPVFWVLCISSSFLPFAPFLVPGVLLAFRACSLWCPLPTLRDPPGPHLFPLRSLDTLPILLLHIKDFGQTEADAVGENSTKVAWRKQIFFYLCIFWWSEP